jgi:tRNA pseudouridine55 synthase
MQIRRPAHRLISPVLNLITLAPGTPFPDPFPKGALLLVDKPIAWTSFDVVNKIRYLLCRRLGIKKLKIGHAGTLDPLATGLLLLCTGDYTKKIEYFQEMPKEYTGALTLGAVTASYDLEKPVEQTFPVAHINPEAVEAVRPRFIGPIQQIPPVFSAVKVDGKRLYKNARTGETVQIEPRTVTIFELELSNLRPSPPQTRQEPLVLNAKGAPIRQYPDYPDGLQLDFRTRCSKGTYIRSLAYDIGQALDSGAYLSSLRRTQTGGYSVENAWQVADLIAWIQKPEQNQP